MKDYRGKNILKKNFDHKAFFLVFIKNCDSISKRISILSKTNDQKLHQDNFKLHLQKLLNNIWKKLSQKLTEKQITLMVSFESYFYIEKNSVVIFFKEIYYTYLKIGTSFIEFQKFVLGIRYWRKLHFLIFNLFIEIWQE